MKRNKLLLPSVTFLTLLAFTLSAAGAPALMDLWIHPRDETYDPARHYVDDLGELYYKAENDLNSGMGDVVVSGTRAAPVVRVGLGPDIWSFVERNSGALRAVIHWDSDGDGAVDRTIRGRIETHAAVFDGPELAEIDLWSGSWQMGLVYDQGVGGVPALHGRYIASVLAAEAVIQYDQVADTPSVGLGAPPGLVILEHRHGEPFDMAQFAEDPDTFAGDFDTLSRGEDLDDWTVDEEREGRLRTHFGEENLFIVRTVGDYDLAIVWGDMPLEEFLETRLFVSRDANGCYNTLDSTLIGDDGVARPLPNRIFYCPEASFALFDAPPGYQIYLTALNRGEIVETTEAGTSIRDNVQLYAHELWPRSPARRGTGSVWGNVKAGFVAAGHDLVDLGKHAVTGRYRENVHTGQRVYRPSPVTAVPLFLWSLARLEPVEAGRNLFGGAASAVAVAADAVSAVNNAVVNPVVQGTVGVAFTPGAADSTQHWFGGFQQAVAQNLPFSERTTDALNPVSAWHHNRAFQPTVYTRTDTQLNIDRVMSIANMVAIRAIAFNGNGGGGGGSSSGGGDAGAGGGGGGGGGMPAVLGPPPGMPPMMPGMGMMPGCD